MAVVLDILVHLVGCVAAMPTGSLRQRETKPRKGQSMSLLLRKLLPTGSTGRDAIGVDIKFEKVTLHCLSKLCTQPASLSLFSSQNSCVIDETTLIVPMTKPSTNKDIFCFLLSLLRLRP